MMPTKPIVLKGKAAKEFEKYQKRPATNDEIKYFKEAEEFYLKHCSKNEPSVKAKRK